MYTYGVTILENTYITWKLLAAIAVLAFLAYQLPLPLLSECPYPDFWYFNADSYRVSMTKSQDHLMVRYQASKHPLFVTVVRPMGRVGRFIYRPLPEPLRENMALTFPVAILGAANACLAFALFLTIGFRGRAAILATILYASSATIWIFSSFPDSYMGTTFFTNAFLLAWLRNRHWSTQAGLTSLAALSAPQQALLGIIPVLKRNVPIVRFTAYAAALFCLPFWMSLLANKMLDLPTGEVLEWSNLSNLLHPLIWIRVIVAFAVMPIVIPFPIDAADPLSFSSFSHEPVVWLALASLIAYGVRMRRWPLPLYCFLYLAFFVCWTPREAFVYSAPLLMPLSLSMHSGWVDRQDSRRWRLGMVLACAVTIVYSVFTISSAGRCCTNYRRVDILTSRVPGKPCNFVPPMKDSSSK